MLSDLTRLLRQRLALPLPGEDAHNKMAHTERKFFLSRHKIPETAKNGSVLFLLYETNNEVRFPLIVRQEYDGVHSGQIALPGGKFEDSDKEYHNTALREAQEEIGIFKNDVDLVGGLTELYIPPSNFLVHPFVGSLSYQPYFIPDKNEVARVIEIGLESIMSEKIVSQKAIKLGNGMEIITPYYNLKGNTVWGATAMILSELRSVLFEIGF